MNKSDIKAATIDALRFLLSGKSLLGLLIANLITFIPFLAGVMYVPLFDSGAVLGAGVIQPFSYNTLWGVTKFATVSCLLGTILLAVPTICYLHIKGKTNYDDYASILLAWVSIVCLISSVIIAFATKNMIIVLIIFLIFPILWVPAWLACVSYWLMVVKKPQHTFKTSSKVMFVLAWLFWLLMSLNFGGFIFTD